MKTKLTVLRQFLILCGLFAISTAFGQTLTWVGLATNSTNSNIGITTNWSGGSPTTGTVGMFNGTVPGNLILTSSDGLDHVSGTPVGGSYGSSGFNFYLPSSQTGSVQIISPIAASALMGLNAITVDSGAGQFILGDNTPNQFLIALRPSASLHGWTNNSANPVIINPSVQLWNGGGIAGHVINFLGTGNWAITNNLRFDNNAPGNALQWDGTGTTIWSAGGANNKFNSDLAGITINAGTVVVVSPGLIPDTPGVNTVVNNAVLRLNAPGKSDTIVRVISGTGQLQVANGTWTLTGASIYTGNTVLSGGELIVGGAETVGISGPIGSNNVVSFSGGTLGFSANNTFDYSSRFSTAAGQAYSFDTAGQNVTFSTGLTSSGATLAKQGPGILTLAGANSYGGETIISGGKLVFGGSKTGTGNITITNGAALGITDTGTQVTPAKLTLGTTSAALLEFNNVHSTTTPPLAASTLSSAGTLTVNINSGTFAVGQSYPLLSWASGSAPAVQLGTVVGAVGTLSTNGNKIQFNVTELALIWNGNTGGNWTAANDWKLAGSSATYADPLNVAFDDTATGTTNVVVNALVQPSSVTVYNNGLTYSITSSSGNDIGGSAAFIKGGGGTLTLSGGANTYTSVTAIGGGVMSVSGLANGGVASDIGAASSSAANLVFNGGTLRYTGAAASIDRLFSLGTGNGVIDASGAGALTLNNSGSVALPGSGVRLLTLTGANTDNNTLAAGIGDNGGATILQKSGTGTWVLTGSNTYSGVTTINNGVLQIGDGGVKGSLGAGNVVNNSRLVFNRSGLFTNDSVISGIGAVTNNGSGTLVFPGNHTYTGGTTLNSGSALQLGTGGSGGALSFNSPITDNGTLIFDNSVEYTYNAGAVISGSGNLIKRGSGLLKLIAANSYTGWTLIEVGSTFQPCDGNAGALASSVITNNGTLKFVRQDVGVFKYAGNIVGTGSVWRETPANGNVGDVTLAGVNTYTGGTIISGGALILGDGLTAGAGSIVGDVLFTNSPVLDTPKQLIFNRSDDYVFNGKITYSTNLPFGNRGIVENTGGGTTILTADNDYPGGTVISAGALQVGNGGATGAIGTGPITDNSLLVVNRSADLTFNQDISGSGYIQKYGAGKLTLNATNTYTASEIYGGAFVINGIDYAGSITVFTGGTLGGNGALYGVVALQPGSTLSPGDQIGTLTCWNDLTVGGNIAIDVDKSQAQSNDVVLAYGNTTYSGSGTLTVANLGPSLQVGDTFQVFNPSLPGGASVAITGGNATWENHLADDGTIKVLTVTSTVNTNPTNIVTTVSGGNLTLSWPVDHTGWRLQVQTNSLSTGLGTNWVDVPGSGSSNTNKITINPANSSVFYRLIYP